MTRLTLLILLIISLAGGVAIGFYGLPDRSQPDIADKDRLIERRNQEIASLKQQRDDAQVELQGRPDPLALQQATDALDEVQNQLLVYEDAISQLREQLDALLAVDTDTLLAEVQAAADTRLEQALKESADALASAEQMASQALERAVAEKDSLIVQLQQTIDANKLRVAELERQMNDALLLDEEQAAKLSAAEQLIEQLRNAPPIQFLINGSSQSSQN